MDYYYDPVAMINRPREVNPNINTSGLNSSNISYGMTGGTAGKPPSWMDVGYAGTPGREYARYSGPGGNFTSSGGAWTDASGMSVSDLPGYLQMRNLQKQGADFSGYQSQLNNLLSNPAAIQQTPGYQFALNQGNEAINRSAAAKGQLNSGNVLAELAKFGQGMASQEYGNQVNRLSGLMQGAQQFGQGTGYYANPQGSTWYGGSRMIGSANAPAPQAGITSVI